MYVVHVVCSTINVCINTTFREMCISLKEFVVFNGLHIKRHVACKQMNEQDK